MTSWIQLLMPPLIGAGVGYFTNDIAVRMLFHPLKPVYILGKKLPFTPGLVPAEQARLAEKISALIVQTLLTGDDFQGMALQLLTHERLEQAVSRSLDALCEEMGQPGKMQLLSEDVGQALAGLIERSVPDLIAHLSDKSLTPERIRLILDRIIDSILAHFSLSPAMAHFLSERLMATLLTPEHLRLSLLSLLTPANIAALDEMAKTHLTGRYAVVMFFFNLPDVLNKLKFFLDTEPERARELIAEVLLMIRLDDAIARALLRINPREMSWEHLNQLKENMVHWLHAYLIQHYDIIIPPLIEKMDVSGLIQHLLQRFDPRELPPAALNGVKHAVTHFLERYLAEKLPTLVEQALEVADIQGLIATKIKNFPPLRMEEIILEVSRKELNLIVLLGGLLGFGIGVLQSLMMWVLP